MGKPAAKQMDPRRFQAMAKQKGLVSSSGGTSRTARPVSAPEAAAQDLNQQYVNEILGYDVQKKYDDILSTKGFLMDDGLTEAGLLAAGALGVGGLGGMGLGNMMGGGNEGLTKEDLMAMQEENPGLMVRYA
jgi:hypothetical protein